MTIDVDGVINLLNVIASEEQVKICVKQSLKGSLLAGTGAFIGGLMGGPVGLVAGGIVGTGFGYAATKDQFVSIPRAIELLPEWRQRDLANHVQGMIDQLDQGDLITLTQIAVTIATSGHRAVMQHHVLRHLVTSSIQYVQTQIADEQRNNPNFFRA